MVLRHCELLIHAYLLPVHKMMIDIICIKDNVVSMNVFDIILRNFYYTFFNVIWKKYLLCFYVKTIEDWKDYFYAKYVHNQLFAGWIDLDWKGYKLYEKKRSFFTKTKRCVCVSFTFKWNWWKEQLFFSISLCRCTGERYFFTLR